MVRLAILMTAAGLALAGCTPAQTQTATAVVTTTLATAQADLANAVKLYGIAKGIAQVAVAADPSLGVVVTSVTNLVDPLVATAQQLVTDAQATAPAAEALAQQINAQAIQLETNTAQAVKVVSGH